MPLSYFEHIMQIIFRHQYALKPEEKRAISTLCSTIFDEFPKDRHYYRQLPHFYWLLHENSPKKPYLGLVAGLLRNIKIEEEIYPILGLLDVCVDPSIRDLGWASKLLNAAEDFSRANNIPLLILFADNPTLYLKNGFESHQALVRWQMIDEVHQKSGNVDERRMDDCFMFKKLDSTIQIPDKPISVDLLGWIF